MTETLLNPAYDTTANARALKGKGAKQAHYYNDLPPVSLGEIVRLRLPGEKRWTVGIYMHQLPRPVQLCSPSG